MNEFLAAVNGFLGSTLLVPVLLGAGLFFTLRLGLIQFRHFTHTFSVMRGSNQCGNREISSFQALCTSLAARVGTGNLAGVAVAIVVGGPGAVFWMWVVAVLGMATSFAESTLAQAFKIRDDEGNFRGGPAYYMEKGLNARWLGIIFSIAMIATFGLAFSGFQSNTIANAMHTAFGLDKWLSGLLTTLLAGLVVFGGIRSIARFAAIAVPFMAIAYLAVALVVVLMNIEQIPAIIKLIVGAAFAPQQLAAGIFGGAINEGVKRGLFSNEAGMGSAPNAAATATPYPPHPASQGYVQMLGVFIDTLVICSATAAIILISGLHENAQGLGGIPLTQAALDGEVGSWGSYFIAVVLFFFAFTSIVANYAYSEGNLVFLEHNHNAGLLLLKLLILAMVMVGAVVPLDAIVVFADIAMSAMALINISAILLLSGIVVALARDYNQQLDAGQVPRFNANAHPKLKQLDTEIWN